MNSLLKLIKIVFLFMPISCVCEYCDPIPLNKISINAHCEYECRTISCERPIPPMTLVRISCKIGYEKPNNTLTDINVCNDFGEWILPIWECKQICGTPLREMLVNRVIANKVVTDIRDVPWHVAVYYHYDEQYIYSCGGSIISSKIVLSAAHCFWNVELTRIGDASQYKIAAGKTFNDINAVEDVFPQIFNISEIITKQQYYNEESLYYNDIAIIILSKYIIFTEFILPVCVDFNLRDSETDISSGMSGKLSGWGMTESGGRPSDILMTIKLPTVDYLTCKAHLNDSFRKYITSDKFCAGFLHSTSSCQGDSGGGLVFNNAKHGMDKYYVYGIASVGPGYLGSCDNTKYSLFTNVNYHINFIKLYLDQYLHNETIFTRPQVRSCSTPVIPENGRIVYAGENRELSVGEVIPFFSAITYKCDNNFTLIGADGDICNNGEWSRRTPNCSKFCDPISLNEISINVHCEYLGKTIPCHRQIPPKTRVSLSCKIGYKKTDSSLPNIIFCDKSGEWNTHPWKCNQTCGIPTPQLNPHLVNEAVTEIEKAPWHVAVYSHVDKEYKYLCGGSIISPKIVLSAANCFLYNENSQIGDASNYTIAAGKSLNDRKAVEKTAPQFFHISEIVTREQYLHDECLYYNDIAIIILSQNIIFTEYILPVCVDFNLRDSKTYLASGMLGKLSGWGFTESPGSTSDILRSIELPTVDFTTCAAPSNISFRKYITSDKFCAGLLGNTSACKGDNGGGLVFNKLENGVDKYYIYGIASLGPSHLEGCDNTQYSLFTNVNYYINMIELYFNHYLHNETIFTRPQGTSCYTSVFPENDTSAHDNNGNCTQFVFHCDDGECLPVENLCDGKIDCSDESDETFKRCASFSCPTFSFQCNYGACISGKAKCDGNKDCIDASDESQELCNYPTPITSTSTQRPTRITTKQQVTTTPPRNDPCYIREIPENGRIVLIALNHELSIGEEIPMFSMIEYKCYSNYTLIGKHTSLCYNGEWSNPTPKCKKYCDPIHLNKVSTKPHCDYQGTPLSCERPIPPKTLVTINCNIGYDKPAESLPDIISCDESGEWNTHPWECTLFCGSPIHFYPRRKRAVNSLVTEIRHFPWHVAVYSYVDEFKCGGSIISSRIVLSAAHCFWDVTNDRIGDVSKYSIAAGKSLHDRNAVEETNPQFFDISKIITKQYRHEERLYYHDIAIIILSEDIIFTEYILPVCVDFNLSLAYASSGMVGKLSGWGMTESGGSPSDILRTVELPFVDYTTCRTNSPVSFRKYITSDKFCAGFLDGTSACQGDSGGGLVFNKHENGIDKYYVYGISSIGPSLKGSCDNTKYSLFTKVNDYINMILDSYNQYLNNV